MFTVFSSVNGAHTFHITPYASSISELQAALSSSEMKQKCVIKNYGMLVH